MSEGLTTDGFLRVLQAMVEKWAELVVREIEKDRASLEQLEPLDDLYLRAVWKRELLEILFGAEQFGFPEKTTDLAKRLAVIDEQFGDQLGLPAANLKPDVKARLEWTKKRVAKLFERDVTDAINGREIVSPIEQIFLMEFKFIEIERGLKDVKLEAQKTVRTDRGEFRIDFAVSVADKAVRVAVELDGHDFHEKTKTQVAADKKRERAITRAGHTVLRFSGYEVVRNSRECVEEVVAFLTK